MDIFEYNEVRWPSRALQQEEEEQAVATAQDNLVPPRIEWQADAQRPTQVQLLVVAMSPASCALLEGCLGGSKAVGTVHCNSSPKQGDSGSSAVRGAAPAPLYATDDTQQVLVCCCNKVPPPEHAPAWGRGLMQELKPQQLLLVGSMQAEQYRGDADPSQEFVAFLLQTSAARQAAAAEGSRQQQKAVPYLPSGSVVAGLPAALLTQAELQGVPADLLVVVDMVPALVPATLHELSGLLGSMLRGVLPGSAGAGDAGRAWVDQLQQEGVVEQARSKLQQSCCRPTAVYS